MVIRIIEFDGFYKVPCRAHHSDTGADIFMPTQGDIHPGETKIIPLGFGVEIPNGHTGRIQVRTSVAKKGIMIQGCAIDAGYIGELHMILHNISRNYFAWHKGDRLGYLEIYPTQYPEFVTGSITKRGDGSFGSTGR